LFSGLARRSNEETAAVRPTSDLEDDRSYTIDEFCLLERFSRPTYFKLKKRGLAPVEYVLPGSTIIRITAAARRAWHERMMGLDTGASRQVMLDRAQKAGQASLASPRRSGRS
jgi:hypothetical protein